MPISRQLLIHPQLGVGFTGFYLSLLLMEEIRLTS